MIHNFQAECGILGCILLDNSIIHEISLMPEHFHDFQNRKLYSAMQELARKSQPINPITLIEEMGHSNFYQLGGPAYLTQLKESVPSIHGFKSYEAAVLEAWKARTAQEILKPIVNDPDFRPDNLQNIIKQLNDIDKTGTREKFNLQEHLVKMYELPNIPVPKGLSGIPSGLNDLDDMTDGFQDEDSIIIGARPSMGKTALMLNIAANAGLKGVIPVIFSLEMSAESLIKRMLSMLGGIDGIKIRNPYHYFNDDDRAHWVKAIGLMEQINLQIFDKPGQTVNEMRAQVRQIKKDYPNKKLLVMIDYLTLIRPQHDHNGNAHLQVSEISAAIKAMAKEFKVPVITLAQLSRSVEQRANKRPVMSDLRESGSIEQDADVIMFLYRDEYYNKDTDKKNILEIDIAKQRNGPTGTIEVFYDKEKNTIRDLVKTL
jgi:replicative DNA helicase